MRHKLAILSLLLLIKSRKYSKISATVSVYCNIAEYSVRL